MSLGIGLTLTNTRAVLEALLKRGDNVVAVYVAPEKPGQKADPLKEAAVAELKRVVERYKGKCSCFFME